MCLACPKHNTQPWEALAVGMHREFVVLDLPKRDHVVVLSLAVMEVSLHGEVLRCHIPSTAITHAGTRRAMVRVEVVRLLDR